MPRRLRRLKGADPLPTCLGRRQIARLSCARPQYARESSERQERTSFLDHRAGLVGLAGGGKLRPVPRVTVRTRKREYGDSGFCRYGASHESDGLE